MVRLLVAAVILGLFVVACGGGDGGSVDGTQPANGPDVDLEAATITLHDLPEGWQPGTAAAPDSLSGFAHSYFTSMEREDGATVRVSMVSDTPESVAALRRDVEAAREQAFKAQISSLDELIPGARKSVGEMSGVVDEAITFIVGPVLTTVWVTFPTGSELEPSVEDVAELVYDRLLKQVQ